MLSNHPLPIFCYENGLLRGHRLLKAHVFELVSLTNDIPARQLRAARFHLISQFTRDRCPSLLLPSVHEPGFGKAGQHSKPAGSCSAESGRRTSVINVTSGPHSALACGSIVVRPIGLPVDMAPVLFQIMSDLHLETHPSYNYMFKQTAPYLALLGDIGLVGDNQLFQFLEKQVK